MPFFGIFGQTKRFCHINLVTVFTGKLSWHLLNLLPTVKAVMFLVIFSWPILLWNLLDVDRGLFIGPWDIQGLACMGICGFFLFSVEDLLLERSEDFLFSVEAMLLKRSTHFLLFLVETLLLERAEALLLLWLSDTTLSLSELSSQRSGIYSSPLYSLESSGSERVCWIYRRETKQICPLWLIWNFYTYIAAFE